MFFASRVALAKFFWCPAGRDRLRILLRRASQAFIRSLAASFLAPGAVLAADALQHLPATAIVRFSGTSTLHDFEGQLPALPFSLLLSNGYWFVAGDVLAGQMATGNEKRDRNMHQMLRTNAFPKIHGEIAWAPIPSSAGSNVTLRLRIRDKTNPLPVRIITWTETAAQIQFHAAWELSLKEYGLKPPSVMGVIRVGDRVKLEAEVTAAKTNLPSGSRNFP